MSHYYLSSCTVAIPYDKGPVTVSDGKSVRYQLERTYSSETQDSRVKRCVIGKVDPVNPARMFPNENYFRLFQDNTVPGEMREAFLRKCEYQREKDRIRKDPDEMVRMVAEGMKMLMQEGKKSGEEGMSEMTIKNVSEYMIIREVFDKLYYYMDALAEKAPNEIVNLFKVRKINEILEEFRGCIEEGHMNQYLQLIEEPREETDEKGNKTLTGMTYSDVMLLLKWYKSMPT